MDKRRRVLDRLFVCNFLKAFSDDFVGGIFVALCEKEEHLQSVVVDAAFGELPKPRVSIPFEACPCKDDALVPPLVRGVRGVATIDIRVNLRSATERP